MSKLTFPIAAALLALSSTIAAAQSPLTIPAQPPSGYTATRTVTLPPASLRGLGALSGVFAAYGAEGDSNASSLLVVTCDSPAKAGVLLGKYRTDLRCLGGVSESTLTIGKRVVPASVIDGRGGTVAFRSGSRVVIATTKRTGGIAALVTALKIPASETLDYIGSPVPTYLDKFDKWGFGFWYPDPLRAPEKQEQTYDVRETLAWAKKIGVSLQFDFQFNHSGSAEGILEDNGKQWAIELARDMGIPAFVQMQGGTAPAWIANRYPEQMQQKIPQFIGSFYGVNGNNGFSGSPLNTLSWMSLDGADQLFSDQYQAVRKYKNLPNVTGYGEWHGEVGEGALAMFMDYGPYADGRFREYLRGKYQTPAAVDKRWGGNGTVARWEDVTFPEPATFLGWNARAVDLKGEWTRAMVENLTPAEKERWGAPDLPTDTWQKLTAPGDDRQIIRSKWRVPTIFRRSFNLTADELARVKSSGKSYLYVWTLQQGFNTDVKGMINGQTLPDQKQSQWASWVLFDVTDKLREGGNVLALNLPWGELSYRTYLSTDEPKCYPALGPAMNARWIDYRDFITWCREDGLRRSIEAIRREDPDKSIKLYAPGAICDVMKGLAEDYGCYFHDTGGMSGNWSDFLPALMRSSGMPMSLEPGNAAHDMGELHSCIGHWMTEGLNTLDYFNDIGDVMWRPDMKAWFETHQPLIHLLGKCHYPTAQVAMMDGERSHRLTGFPWDHFDTPLLWSWRRNGVGTLGRLPNPRDVITETDFGRGNAGRYRVIVDDATLVMDDALVAQIEAWVRAGGIFITQGQTGRHSPEVPDTWTISRLTGYKVIGNNDNWRVGPIAGQPIFTDPAWSKTDPNGTPSVGGAGVLLEKVSPECQDILRWGKDGPIAMGVRTLGKGKVITMGTPMPGVASGWPELLKWCGVDVPAPPTAPGCRVARFVANNGLSDIYVVWAEKVTTAGPITLTLPGKQTTIIDVLTGAKLTGTATADGVSFSGIAVEPAETYAFIVPRDDIDNAPLAWVSLQREWWKGTKKPAPAPVLPPWKNTTQLDADWAFSAVPATVTEIDNMMSPALDDKAWLRKQFGVWYGPANTNTTRGVYRKKISVPAAWTASGRTWLWIRRSAGRALLPSFKTQVYLDGKLIYDNKGWAYGFCVQDITEGLAPGEHLLAVYSESKLPVGGTAGNVWLEHVPEPAARQLLAGDWNGMQVPGAIKPPIREIRRDIVLDAAHKGRKTMLYVETTENNIVGIIVNGRFINRDIGGLHFLMDLTPYLKDGQTNSLTLTPQYTQNPATIKAAELRFYDPGSF
ncbi:MAG TPA: alpha-amylase family protein [Capsulimonadaceae bacterium]